MYVNGSIRALYAPLRRRPLRESRAYYWQMWPRRWGSLLLLLAGLRLRGYGSANILLAFETVGRDIGLF